MVSRMASINPPGVFRRTRNERRVLLFGLCDGAGDDLGGDGVHHAVHVHGDDLRRRGGCLRDERKHKSRESRCLAIQPQYTLLGHACSETQFEAAM